MPHTLVAPPEYLDFGFLHHLYRYCEFVLSIWCFFEKCKIKIKCAFQKKIKKKRAQIETNNAAHTHSYSYK